MQLESFKLKLTMSVGTFVSIDLPNHKIFQMLRSKSGCFDVIGSFLCVLRGNRHAGIIVLESVFYWSSQMKEIVEDFPFIIAQIFTEREMTTFYRVVP